MLGLMFMKLLNQNKMKQQENTPKVKGAYVLGSRNKTNTIAFHLAFKPKWLHRQMMRIFLGWYWVDEIK